MLEIKKKYSEDQVKILSINVINRKGRVKAEVEKYKINYTVLLGRSRGITSDYKIKKLPHLFIIDQKGIIRASKRFLKADEIKKNIDELLKKKENTAEEK